MAGSGRRDDMIRADQTPRFEFEGECHMGAAAEMSGAPSPALVLETLLAYERSAALKAAIYE